MIPCPVWILKKLTFGSWDRIPCWVRFLFPTVHFCAEFDGLAIDRHCPEWEFCYCLKKSPKN